MDNTEIINIAGWSKFSTVDWPEKITATLFLQGCPWRCGYCHNFEILDPRQKGEVSFKNKVLPFLEKRKGLLDGVVFSGGEPTLQDGLQDAIKSVQELGFKIGLHTGGAYPENLKKIIQDIDFIGFDIKAPEQKYKDITRLSNSWENANKSLELVQDFKGEIQFRTTFDLTVLDSKDIMDIRKMLKSKGFNQELVVQECRTIGTSEEYQQKYSNFLKQ